MTKDNERTVNIECTDCEGTGLCVGMAEREGAAVICNRCKGTGKEEYSYTIFTGKKFKDGVTRVFKGFQNYAVKGHGTITYDNGAIVDFDKEGVSYDEWLQGKQPRYIESLSCPMMADQSACHHIHGFTGKCNELNGQLIHAIPKCKLYTDFAACWDRFYEWSQS